MRPELTIAIPTFNRVEKLKQSLNLAITYSRGLNVEVLVSDNASTDGTEEFMKEVRNNQPEVKYYRNSENLGFDGNFLNCFNNANGKYMMLLSDDDILLPGAVESILEVVKDSPVCVYLNSSTLVDENTVRHDNPRYKEQGILKYTDKNEFLREIGIMCTFISSLVFNTDLVHAVQEKKKYYGTTLMQSHIYFETMKTDGEYIINKYNCLAVRSNITIGYDLYITWVKNFSELMLSTGKSCGFNPSVLDEILHDELRGTVLKFVLSFRRTCDNEKNWNKKCIWKYVNRYPDIVLWYKLAVFCPKWALLLIRKLLGIRNRLEKWINKKTNRRN